MSPASKRGQRWLDSLARWAAGGRGDADPPGAGDGPVPAAAGTTRRIALRTAAGAGAAAVLAPMRLLEPSIAGAAPTQLADCRAASAKRVYDDFRACVKGPLSEFEDTGKFIDEYEAQLRTLTKPAARKRVKKRIADLTRRRGRALKDIEFCNGAFVRDRAEAEEKCQAANPPSGGTGGGGTGGPGGCESGYVLCGDYCCGTAYAFCQVCNGQSVCCRIGGECCPGS